MLSILEKALEPFACIKSKKGVIVLYLTMIFVSIMILISALITISIHRGIDQGAKVAGRIFSNSILGEYDQNLLRDYGIFAYYGLESDVNKKLNRYVKEAVSGKKYIGYDGLECELTDFSLSNINAFQKAIRDAPKGKKERRLGSAKERKIENDRIIESLPSHQLKGQIIDKSSKAMALAYGSTYFNNLLNCAKRKSGYLSYEMEYLIGGKRSDSRNLATVKGKYILERMGANSAFLYSDKEMRTITLTLAEAITPGAGAPVTQAIIVETWAMLESENDWKLITNGEKVPLIKTRDSWALDETVLKEDDFNGFVNPHNKSGMDYEENLEAMLLLMDEERLLLRMMDLIQINMKYLYYDDFLMSQYNIGLKYQMMINGETYEFCDQY